MSFDEASYDGDVLVDVDELGNYVYVTMDDCFSLSAEWAASHSDWRYYYTTAAITKFFADERDGAPQQHVGEGGPRRVWGPPSIMYMVRPQGIEP